MTIRPDVAVKEGGEGLDTLQSMINDRILSLERIIDKAKAFIDQAPEGTLRVSSSKRGIQYYRRSNGRKDGGTYIKTAQIDLAKALAQKEYFTELLKVAEKELRVLKRYDQTEALAQVYRRMPEGRRALVRPVCIPREDYADRWQALTYTRKPIDDDFPEYYTNRGERVRSKSEILIANKLNELNLNYHYEKPLKLSDGSVIYPDFTVLHSKTNATLYLEHFGKMDDVAYVETNLRRIDRYIDSAIYPGTQLFITYETGAVPLNMWVIDCLFKAWFM